MSEASLLIACPHCNVQNRLQQTRLSQAPNCGKCHQPLFTGAPVALNAANFDTHALHNGLPLLIDFWAPWCGPCLMMAPQFAAAAVQLEPKLRLAKVDTEAEPALGARFAIRSIPTLLLLHNGREIARQSGAMGTTQIVGWARGHIGSAG